jgi:hypothetical protein
LRPGADFFEIRFSLQHRSARNVEDIEMGYFVTARIWEPVHAMIRSLRYESPLFVALNQRGGGRVIGTSTCMSTELEVEYVDIDLDLDNLEEALDLVKSVLVKAGAPAGSEFRLTGDGGEEIVNFGKMEGLAVYLDGVNLSDDIYMLCNINELADLIKDDLAAAGGEIRGSWVGPNETSIYMYGPDAEAMFTALEPILAGYPLCRNARVVIRHGNPALSPRTVRLPRDE